MAARDDFDRFFGAWTGMIAGNNNGLFFENKYGIESVVEDRIEGILTRIDRDAHTEWAFNVYDILLRYGSMVDDDTIMEWLLVEEILKRGRLPGHMELGGAWVSNLNYRNYGEGRFALEQFERGIAPPHHLDDDSGLAHTEHAKDWGICAQIYNELLGALLYKHPDRLGVVARYYAAMTNRGEAVEAAVYAIAMQNAAMRMDSVEDIIEFGLDLLDPDSMCAKQMRRARDLAHRHADWRDARQEFLRGLPPHSRADALPNSGLFTLALIYGKADFADSMSLCIQMGYDTDCSACTLGGILGAMLGESAIPPAWKLLLLGEYNNMIWDKWDGCQRYDKYAWELPERIAIEDLSRRTLHAAEIVTRTGAALATSAKEK